MGNLIKRCKQSDELPQYDRAHWNGVSVILGRRGSGKTTFATKLSKKYPNVSKWFLCSYEKQKSDCKNIMILDRKENKIDFQKILSDNYKNQKPLGFILDDVSMKFFENSNFEEFLRNYHEKCVFIIISLRISEIPNYLFDYIDLFLFTCLNHRATYSTYQKLFRENCIDCSGETFQYYLNKYKYSDKSLLIENNEFFVLD